MTGDLVIRSCVALSAVNLVEEGVPAVEVSSLVGEIDLARSEYQLIDWLSTNT